MPVEIRELTIKVNVNGEQAGNAPAPSQGAGGGDAKEALIKEAVEEVMRILENKKER
jgi:hypothetical protein